MNEKKPKKRIKKTVTVAVETNPFKTNPFKSESHCPPIGEHEQKLTLSVDIYVPDHPDRTTTPIFAATRCKLIENNPDACCYICGCKTSLELHHAVIEWCDSLAVDWQKVALDVHGFDWKSFDETKVETFIDSEHNANMVLCKEHHTGKNHGIHCLPGPIWKLQKYKRNNFTFSPDESK